MEDKKESKKENKSKCNIGKIIFATVGTLENVAISTSYTAKATAHFLQNWMGISIPIYLINRKAPTVPMVSIDSGMPPPWNEMSWRRYTETSLDTEYDEYADGGWHWQGKNKWK